MNAVHFSKRRGGFCVHDEILLEAPMEASDELVSALKEALEEAGKVSPKTVAARLRGLLWQFGREMIIALCGRS